MWASTNGFGRFVTLAGMILSLAVLGIQGAQAQSAPPPPARTTETFDQAVQQNAQRQNQPLNNAQTWRAVRGEGQHYTTDRGREAGVLIQSGGETWRQQRNRLVIPLGGWIFLGVLGLIAAFYLTKGTIKLKHAPTGRAIERFSAFERTAHWTLAISFTLLAVSGLVMTFGKWVLLPVIGHTLFAALTILCKNVHNFVGPLFSVALVVVFLTFLKDNWPKGYDWQWIAKGGGLFNGSHVPSGRFNMGEKVWFWGGVFFLGIAVTVTGFVLNEIVPGIVYGRALMQQMNILHLVFTLLFMTGALGHIYMGTLGMEGAFNAMKTGYVDEAWAQEHHEYWYNDMRDTAKPASGGPLNATAAARQYQD
jgi:formate dehydrogenase subunit gamma